MLEIKSWKMYCQICVALRTRKFRLKILFKIIYFQTIFFFWLSIGHLGPTPQPSHLHASLLLASSSSFITPSIYRSLLTLSMRLCLASWVIWSCALHMCPVQLINLLFSVATMSVSLNNSLSSKLVCCSHRLLICFCGNPCFTRVLNNWMLLPYTI